MNKIRLGTRGSQLAMWQADQVASLLSERYPETAVETVKIKTTGDKILDSPLAKIGDKGLFVKEIETALLDGKVDIAVHSAKDMPTDIPTGLTLAAYLKRDDPADALVSADGVGLSALREGAVVGTSSLRRRAQLISYRADFQFVDLRGNVDTRLRKLNDEGLDAIILSGAGLTRLKLGDKITERIPTSIIVPAVGQGLIVVEARDDDEGILTTVDFLNDSATETCVLAERAFSEEIGGGCQVPMGALAVLDGQTLNIQAVVASLDGDRVLKGELTASAGNPVSAGQTLAGQLRDKGADEILAQIRRL